MDDILASIRKIVSEDDAPAGPAPAAGEPPAAAHMQQLADRFPEATSQEPHAAAPDNALVGDTSASAAESSFETLKAAADDAARARSTLALPAPGRTLEEVTRELLRPLLKAWLDEHLPAIVQDKVDEEVARIARGRVR